MITRRGFTWVGIVVILSQPLVRQVARLAELTVYAVCDLPRKRVDVHPTNHHRIRCRFQVPRRLEARRALQQLVRLANDGVLAIVTRLALADGKRSANLEHASHSLCSACLEIGYRDNQSLKSMPCCVFSCPLLQHRQL